MIRADGSHTIGHSEFANTVKPGMVLEMSIVLRQPAAFQDNKQKCPRCHHVNLNVTTTSGWIDWKVPLTAMLILMINVNHYSSKCSGQFQVAEAGADDKKSLQNGDYVNGEAQSEGGDEDSIEDITSPAASYVVALFREAIDNQRCTVEQDGSMLDRVWKVKIHRQAMPTKHIFSAASMSFAWIISLKASIHQLRPVNLGTSYT